MLGTKVVVKIVDLEEYAPWCERMQGLVGIVSQETTEWKTDPQNPRKAISESLYFVTFDGYLHPPRNSFGSPVYGFWFPAKDLQEEVRP